MSTGQSSSSWFADAFRVRRGDQMQQQQQRKCQEMRFYATEFQLKWMPTPTGNFYTCGTGPMPIHPSIDALTKACLWHIEKEIRGNKIIDWSICCIYNALYVQLLMSDIYLLHCTRKKSILSLSACK